MPKLDEAAKGVYVITVTPFKDDGALDLESTDRVIDFYLDKGATGLTVLGVMGEAHKQGIPSNATMLYGHIESVEERVDHLIHLRNLQDETGGFVTFIPLAFQP